MTEVVRHPGGEKLPQRDGSKLRVFAFQRELAVGQVPAPQGRNVFPPELFELIQQDAETLALALAGLGEPIVRLEARLAPCARMMRARGIQSARSP